MNCKTKNVCYLLTCDSCDDQYVGETKRQLNHRINRHNSDSRDKGQESFYCKLLQPKINAEMYMVV